MKRFAKIALEPGAEETVRFTLTSDGLSSIGLENRRIVEPGLFRIDVGKLTREFNLD